MDRRSFLRGSIATAGVVASSLAQAQGNSVINIRDFLVLNFCRRLPHLRRDIGSLLQSGGEHPIVAAYRRAVEHMKTLPDDDPHSWAYQANIHGTLLPVNAWPAGAPFATCQHGPVFFLNWHRMYVYFFERIVRSISGYDDFALPYWDYTQASQRALPQAFRLPVFGSGNNTFHDGTRSSAVNNGNPLPASATSAAIALAQPNFLGSGQFQSTLSGTPHGAVHVSIGGNMGNFQGAGRDPIFWLHHCNIDRLWEKWLSLGGGHSNPTNDSSWMSTQFTFVDECRRFIRMTGAEVQFTVSQLNYQYQDPIDCVPLLALPMARLQMVEMLMQPRTELLVAKDVRLKGERIDIGMEPTDENRKFLSGLLSQARPPQDMEQPPTFLLAFEGLTTEAPINGYFEVYLNLPKDENPTLESSSYVGNLTFFGADPASRSTQQDMGDHPFALNITKAIAAKARRDQLSHGISVTLVPQGVVDSDSKTFQMDEKASPRVEAILLQMQ